MTRTRTAYGIAWLRTGQLVRTNIEPLLRNRRSDVEVFRDLQGADFRERTAVVRVTLAYEAPARRRGKR